MASKVRFSLKLSVYELVRTFILNKFEYFNEGKNVRQKESSSVLKITDHVSKSFLNSIDNRLEECQQNENLSNYLVFWKNCQVHVPIGANLLVLTIIWKYHLKGATTTYDIQIVISNVAIINFQPITSRLLLKFPLLLIKKTLKTLIWRKRSEKNDFPPTILIQRRCKILNPNDQRVEQSIKEYNSEIHHWFLEDSRKEGANGHLQVYLSHECIVRVAARKYNSKDDDVDAHLTNICFQLRRGHGQERVYFKNGGHLFMRNHSHVLSIQ
ncbi:7481_t:CDS:2 [Ambispora gerdemannii]|uniref:7481_t:CDS:1 n=1 Tax=Ambispora gerdemannii TaxID=144530 RepID=A0A9N9C0C9_9GLOM|nr:7481_t:CDS:2 [Ambispora gerdemannii]